MNPEQEFLAAIQAEKDANCRRSICWGCASPNEDYAAFCRACGRALRGNDPSAQRVLIEHLQIQTGPEQIEPGTNVSSPAKPSVTPNSATETAKSDRHPDVSPAPRLRTMPNPEKGLPVTSAARPFAALLIADDKPLPAEFFSEASALLDEEQILLVNAIRGARRGMPSDDVPETFYGRVRNQVLFHSNGTPNARIETLLRSLLRYDKLQVCKLRDIRAKRDEENRRDADERTRTAAARLQELRRQESLRDETCRARLQQLKELSGAEKENRLSAVRRESLQIVTQHLDTLLRQRRLKLRKDAYGNFLGDDWAKEIGYFVQKVIIPKLSHEIFAEWTPPGSAISPYSVPDVTQWLLAGSHRFVLANGWVLRRDNARQIQLLDSQSVQKLSDADPAVLMGEGVCKNRLAQVALGGSVWYIPTSDRELAEIGHAIAAVTRDRPIVASVELAAEPMRVILRPPEVAVYLYQFVRDYVDSMAAQVPSFVGSAETPEDFEVLCESLLQQSGWDARRIGGTGDQGADILASRNGVTAVFQCKLYSSPVGNSAVQEIHTAKAFYSAKFAAVVSCSGYTQSARQVADAIGVRLLEPTELSTLC